jgi:prolyl 4-hydroxylase
MAGASIAKAAGIWAGGLLLGLGIPYLPSLSSPRLTSFIGDFPVSDYPFAFPFFKNTTNSTAAGHVKPFVCDTSHTYRTELVSLEPLIIYIHNLVTPIEIDSLLETAEPRFAPSQVTKYGRQQQTSDRTSSSAGLPRDDPAVMCVLNRTRTFLGTMLRDGWDEMGPPQLVRYTSGQRFNVHHDWFEYPQWAPDGSMRKWNRVASFFAILEDNCTGGETHFPYAKPIVSPSPRGEVMWQGGVPRTQEETAAKPLWREHEEGGLAFRPVAGNAIFWVNLHPNGTGDPRTNHAGLPLEKGLKTAMNIWPRQYYAYE